MVLKQHAPLLNIEFNNVEGEPYESFKNHINGEWVDSSGQETLPMVAPATGKHYGVISESTNEDVRSL